MHAAATTSNDLQRFNAAFWELGLRWSWSEATYQRLAHLPDDRARIAAYLREQQPHLLASYPEDFLAGMIAERVACPGTGGRLGLEAFASI